MEAQQQQHEILMGNSSEWSTHGKRKWAGYHDPVSTIGPQIPGQGCTTNRELKNKQGNEE